MHIEKISLLNFRNYDFLDLELNSNVNIFCGDNAQGKTNLLEAMYFSAMGRSHKTTFYRELIQFEKTEAHIKSLIKNDSVTDKIDIHLHSDGKKGIAINSLPIKNSVDLFGILLVVMFSPEDLNLIKSGPSARRRFLDMELCQLSKVYYYNLRQYYKILKNRNNLLKKIQKNRSAMDMLEGWDIQLVEYGVKIAIQRDNFLKKLNDIAKEIYFNITDNKEELSLQYKPGLEISGYEDKLKKNIERDIFTGVTNYGIHKDDINFYVNNNNVKNFGSQGQQRTSVLAVKLAEIEIIRDEKNQNPVLLLDDVLSELDINRQKYLLNNIENTQTFITCTGIVDLLMNLDNSKKIYYVSNGKIT